MYNIHTQNWRFIIENLCDFQCAVIPAIEMFINTVILFEVQIISYNRNDESSETPLRMF